MPVSLVRTKVNPPSPLAGEGKTAAGSQGEGKSPKTGFLAAVLPLLFLAVLLTACQAPPPTPHPLEAITALRTSGQYTEAGRQLTALIDQHPDDPAYIFALAQLYADWHRPEYGLPALERAIDQGATFSETWELNLRLLTQAEDWQSILSLDWPDSAATGEARTTANLQLGNCDAAATAAQTWAQYAPENLDAVTTKAILSAGTDGICEVNPALCNELAACGVNNTCLGKSLIREQNWPLAVCVLQQAVDENDADINAHLWLGESLLRMGNGDDGKWHLKRALAYEPDFAMAWLLLGLRYLSESDTTNARDALLEAQRLAPDNPAPCLAILELKALDGKYREMATWANAAVIRAPEDMAVWKAVARVYLNYGLDVDGYPLRALQHVLDVDDTDAEAHMLMGWAMLNAGDLTTALSHLDTALSLNPVNGHAYLLRALAYEMAGDLDAAEQSRIAANDLGWFD